MTAGAGIAAGDAAPRGAAPVAGRGLLRLEGISKRFGDLAALRDVHIDFPAGEVHCLLGENGAGKSTLCNIVFGVHEADAGAMTLGGAPYRPTGPAEALGAGIAMVHQHFSLLEDMSVVDNLVLGQGRGVLKRQEWAEKVRALGERFSPAARTLRPRRRLVDR